MSDKTRITLIQRVQSGTDETAWDEFSRIYGRYLYLLVRGLGIAEADADDLVQNCLLAIWKAMPTYEYGKNGATFRTWAAVVARRVVIDHCRRRDRRIKTNILDEDAGIRLEPGRGDDAYLDFVEKEWRTYLVNLAFERIRPNFSDKAIEVFEAALEGRTPREIAETFDLKQDYVRKLRSRVGKRLEREIRQLRAELE